MLLVTHDHFDHNGVEAVGGDPTAILGAGTHESPIGEIVGVNSEHDAVAGTVEETGSDAELRTEGGPRVLKLTFT